MYRVLKGEMVKAGMSVSSLALKIGVTDKTLRNKLNEETDFTWPEAQAIRRIVNPKMKIEELFKTDSEEVV